MFPQNPFYARAMPIFDIQLGLKMKYLLNLTYSELIDQTSNGRAVHVRGLYSYIKTIAIFSHDIKRGKASF